MGHRAHNHRPITNTQHAVSTTVATTKNVPTCRQRVRPASRLEQRTCIPHARCGQCGSLLSKQQQQQPSTSLPREDHVPPKPDNVVKDDSDRSCSCSGSRMDWLYSRWDKGSFPVAEAPLKLIWSRDHATDWWRSYSRRRRFRRHNCVVY